MYPNLPFTKIQGKQLDRISQTKGIEQERKISLHPAREQFSQRRKMKLFRLFRNLERILFENEEGIYLR